jgi:hypothetical protein
MWKYLNKLSYIPSIIKLIGILLLFSSLSFSRGGISGILKSWENKGIPNALVQLYSSNGKLIKQKRSNYRGAFTFWNIKNDIYSIKITKSGYHKRNIYNIVIDGKIMPTEIEYPSIQLTKKRIINSKPNITTRQKPNITTRQRPNITTRQTPKTTTRQKPKTTTRQKPNTEPQFDSAAKFFSLFGMILIIAVVLIMIFGEVKPKNETKNKESGKKTKKTAAYTPPKRRIWQIANELKLSSYDEIFQFLQSKGIDVVSNMASVDAKVYKMILDEFNKNKKIGKKTKKNIAPTKINFFIQGRKKETISNSKDGSNPIETVKVVWFIVQYTFKTKKAYFLRAGGILGAELRLKNTSGPLIDFLENGAIAKPNPKLQVTKSLDKNVFYENDYVKDSEFGIGKVSFSEHTNGISSWIVFIDEDTQTTIPRSGNFKNIKVVHHLNKEQKKRFDELPNFSPVIKKASSKKPSKVKPPSLKNIVVLPSPAQREQQRKENLERKRKAQVKKTNLKKPNWREFKKILNEYNIKKLYHFTDENNFNSIKKHGALYSWSALKKKGIEIPNPGGDELSRKLDLRKGLEDYVRLSFTIDHPMEKAALYQGRINNPIQLAVPLDVIYLKDTLFSDINAAANDAKIGGKLSDFKKINFDVVSKGYYDNDDIDEKKYIQAEVLVKTKILTSIIKLIK